MVVAQTQVKRASRMAMGLPCGRRVPRGSERWYLLKVREGAEDATCEKLLRLVPRDILTDCFCIKKERWFKRGGAWSLQTIPAYRGYAFAVTADPAALYKQLAGASTYAELCGADGRAWMPLSPAAQTWFARCMDERHVLRGSTAVIEDGILHVTEGPLKGQEAHVRDVDRHRRRCMVDVGDGALGGFSELMAIDVPIKT